MLLLRGTIVAVVNPHVGGGTGQPPLVAPRQRPASDIDDTHSSALTVCYARGVGARTQNNNNPFYSENTRKNTEIVGETGCLVTETHTMGCGLNPHCTRGVRETMSINRAGSRKHAKLKRLVTRLRLHSPGKLLHRPTRDALVMRLPVKEHHKRPRVPIFWRLKSGREKRRGKTKWLNVNYTS